MKGFQQLIQRLEDAKKQFLDNREAEVLRIAQDEMALIKLRIQREGKNSQGQKFVPYTPTYAAKRQKYGAQTEHVDFTVTGGFWANVRPIVVERGLFNTKVQIMPDSAGFRKWLRGWYAKRGDVLLPSEEEIALLRKTNRARILKYFNI